MIQMLFTHKAEKIGIAMLRERAPGWAWQTVRTGFAGREYSGTRDGTEVSVSLRSAYMDDTGSEPGEWWVYGDGAPDHLHRWLRKQAGGQG